MLIAGVAVAFFALAPTAATDPACAPLVERVASGQAPLSELVARCKPEDVARAALAATIKPETSGFVAAPGKGSGVVWSHPFGEARVSWEGRCLARVEEALPEPPLAPLAQCLDGAIVREHAQPTRPEDERAHWLMKDPRTLERWRRCRKHTPAERCLDRLLPLSGSGSPADKDVATWIAARDQPDPDAGKVREARCRLALVDRDSGLLAFRCEGELVEKSCAHTWNVAFGSSSLGESVTCGADNRALVVVADVGRAPDVTCVAKARAAAGASGARFPAARAAALAACAPDPPAPDPEDPLEDGELSPAARRLIHRVLARQQALFGPFKFPQRCKRVGDGCVGTKDGGLARVIAHGCGNKVWTVWPGGSSGYGDGSWSDEGPDNSGLIRLPASAPPREPLGHVMAIGHSLRSGNYFANVETMGTKFFTEADLIDEACVAKKGNEYGCQAYAVGGHQTDMVGWRSAAEWTRVKQLVDADWPRASRRLARWQRELSRGIRLDHVNGEQQSWTCTALVADACTGDIAEVCTGLDLDDSLCDGRRLADGRCHRYRFARLPLSPARPMSP